MGRASAVDTVVWKGARSGARVRLSLATRSTEGTVLRRFYQVLIPSCFAARIAIRSIQGVVILGGSASLLRVHSSFPIPGCRLRCRAMFPRGVDARERKSPPKISSAPRRAGGVPTPTDPNRHSPTYAHSARYFASTYAASARSACRRPRSRARTPRTWTRTDEPDAAAEREGKLGLGPNRRRRRRGIPFGVRGSRRRLRRDAFGAQFDARERRGEFRARPPRSRLARLHPVASDAISKMSRRRKRTQEGSAPPSSTRDRSSAMATTKSRAFSARRMRRCRHFCRVPRRPRRRLPPTPPRRRRCPRRRRFSRPPPMVDRTSASLCSESSVNPAAPPLGVRVERVPRRERRGEHRAKRRRLANLRHAAFRAQRLYLLHRVVETKRERRRVEFGADPMHAAHRHQKPFRRDERVRLGKRPRGSTRGDDRHLVVRGRHARVPRSIRGRARRPRSPSPPRAPTRRNRPEPREDDGDVIRAN